MDHKCMLYATQSQSGCRDQCVWSSIYCTLRPRKHWIMTCSCVKEHSAALHSETHATWIARVSHPLWFDNRTKPYCNLNFILIIHAATHMELIMMVFRLVSQTHALPLSRQSNSPTPKFTLLVEPLLPGRAGQDSQTNNNFWKPSWTAVFIFSRKINLQITCLLSNFFYI